MAMTTGIIKICDSGILKPLSIIFCNALNSGIFPDSQKHSRIVLVHSKENKQLMQHCPVSLAGSSKIFEIRQNNSLFCSNQSGFRETDSCVNHFLPIVH